MDEELTHWLEQSYRDHRDQLFRCAWLILRDTGRAEDTVHAAADKREVIELRLRANLTFAEIGQMLSESESTVTSRYKRAIDELKKQNGVFDERH